MSIFSVVLLAALLSAAPENEAADGSSPAINDETRLSEADIDKSPAAPDEIPVAPPRPPPPDIHTNPAYWSKGGWRELRWGMGPGDAFSRMDNAAYANWIPWASKAADPIAGTMFFRFRDPTLSEVNDLLELRFGERGLAGVTLQRDETGLLAEAAPHFDSALKKLSSKHGEPNCFEFVDGKTCEWRAKSVRIQLRLAATYANLAEDERLTNLFLEYFDAGVPSRDDARITKKDVSVRTDPRTWSDLRIKQIRLGMGLGDIIDRVLGKRVWNRPVNGGFATCVFACKRSGTASINCEVREGCAVLDGDAGGLSVRNLSFNAEGRLCSAGFELEDRDRSRLEHQFQDVVPGLMRQFSSRAVRAVKQDSAFVEDDVSHLSAHILRGPRGADSLVIRLSTKVYDRAPDRKPAQLKRRPAGMKDI
jgi:hypothetical protein